MNIHIYDSIKDFALDDNEVKSIDFWRPFSRNTLLTLSELQNHPSLISNLDTVAYSQSSANTISEIMADYNSETPTIPWSTKGISMHNGLTLAYVQSQPNFPWDIPALIRNNDISLISIIKFLTVAQLELYVKIIIRRHDFDNRGLEFLINNNIVDWNSVVEYHAELL